MLSTTPGEQAAATGQRVNQGNYAGRLASRQRTDYGSPLAGDLARFQAASAGDARLAQAQSAQQQQYVQDRINNRSYQDTRLANDPQALARARVMGNNPNLQQVDTASYRNQIANATTKYQMYSRGMLASGQQPMSFDSFLQRSAQGLSSPDITQPMEYGRSLAQAKSAEKRGPTFFQRYKMSQMYGVPMNLGDDLTSLAAAGNQNALAIRKQEMEGQAKLAEIAAQNAPKPPTYEQSVQMHGLIGGVMEMGQKAYDQVINDSIKDGSWNQPGMRKVITERANEARKLANESANRRLASMQQDPSLSPFFGQNQYGIPTLPPAASPALSSTEANGSTGNPSAVSPPNTSSITTTTYGLGVSPAQAKRESDFAALNAPPVVDLQPATPQQMFEAYRAIKAATGQEPSVDAINSRLKEGGYRAPIGNETNGGVLRNYASSQQSTGACYQQ